MKCSSPTLKAGIVLSILGVSLIGCTQTPPDPPTPSDARFEIRSVCGTRSELRQDRYAQSLWSLHAAIQ